MHTWNPPTATPGESFALSTRQLRAPAARPCPSGSVPARPRLHSHFENIIRLRVSGCLICASAGERGHTYSPGQAAGRRTRVHGQERERFPAHPDPERSGTRRCGG